MKREHEKTVEELALDSEYIDKVHRKLETFKNRWFAWGKSPEEDGRVIHFMACNIYRAKKVYGFATCTCGLLYDLNAHLPLGSFADKLFPLFGKQFAAQDRTWEEEQEWNAKSEEEKRKDRDKCQAMLEKAFPDLKDRKPDPEEDQKWDEFEWGLIHEVFGPNFRKNNGKNI